MDPNEVEKAEAKAEPRGNFFKLGLLCGLLLGALAWLLIRRDAEPELAETTAPAAAPQGPLL